jgi:hypothetical protein
MPAELYKKYAEALWSRAAKTRERLILKEKLDTDDYGTLHADR